MSKKIIISVIVLASIVMITFFFLHGTENSDYEIENQKTFSQNGKSTSDARNELGQQIIRRNQSVLNSDMSELRDRIEELEAKKNDSSENNEKENSDEIVPDHGQKDPNAEYNKAIERLKDIENAFFNEKRDEHWASETEQQLSEIFKKGEYTNTEMTALDCKSTFCRMKVEHLDKNSRYNFEKILHDYEGGFYLQHISPNEDDSSESIAFFVRRENEKENYIYQMMH